METEVLDDVAVVSSEKEQIDDGTEVPEKISAEQEEVLRSAKEIINNSGQDEQLVSEKIPATQKTSETEKVFLEKKTEPVPYFKKQKELCKKSTEFRSPKFALITNSLKEGFVHGVERVLTAMKKLVGPYYSSRRDLLDVIQLNFRDKNWEEAKERGHGWIPKWVCGLIGPEGVFNYAGKVLDWLGGSLTKKVWQLRQKIGNGISKLTEKPINFLVKTVTSVSKKIGKIFLGGKKQTEVRKKRRNFVSKLKKGIANLDSWMHRPVKFGKKK